MQRVPTQNSLTRAMFMSKAEQVAEMRSHCSEERKAMLSDTMANVMRPVHEWPLKEAAKFLGSHVGFNDRCSLVYFLAVNGCPPSIIPQWAKAQSGWLRTDKSALHMATLIDAWGKGEFEGDTGKQLKTAWNMETGMVQTVYTPSFAYETDGQRAFDYKPGANFWKDAAYELRTYAKMLPRKQDADRFGTPAPRPDKLELMNKWMTEERSKLSDGVPEAHMKPCVKCRKPIYWPWRTPADCFTCGSPSKSRLFGASSSQS